MAIASAVRDMSNDAAMGFCHAKDGSRCDRIGRNADGIRIERKSPCPGLRKDVKKGSMKPLVVLPLRVGWKMFPLRGPVADHLASLRSSRSGKMSDAGINPSDCIDGIRAIGWGPVANKEIFRNIF